MKRIIITGASRGIGKATTEKFLSEGWEVVGTSTLGKGWEHERLSWVQLQMTDPASIERAAQEIAKVGNINVLINNAGIGEEEVGDALEASVLRRTLEVNVIGAVDLTNRLLPIMASPSHIINMSSLLSSLTQPEPIEDDWYLPAYSISKAALNMYTRTLGHQLEPKGITVSSIDPGWVKTDMGGEEAPREVKEAAEEIFALAIADVPTGRFWFNGKEREW